MNKFMLLILLSAFSFNPCFGQFTNIDKLLTGTSCDQKTDSLLDIVDSLKDVTPSIEISDEFTNNVVFWGRLYQQKQYGSQTNVVYKNGKGLYIYAIENYWSKMKKPWAETDLGIEYDKQLSDNSYASLSYERWISSKGNKQKRGALQNDMEMKFNYDFNYFSVEPGVYYMFGNLTVFQSDLLIKGNYKLFRFSKTGRVFFKPEFMITGSTCSILRIAYASLPPGNFNNNTFKIVDYELALPFALQYKNFELSLAVHSAYPINIIPSENLKPFLYYTAGLSYTGFFGK
jgi:hypothetical protein